MKTLKNISSVLIFGTLGLIIGALLFLSALGDMLEVSAEPYPAELQELVNKATVESATDASFSIGDNDESTNHTATFNGEHHALQPVGGYRTLQPTYSPQTTIAGN